MQMRHRIPTIFNLSMVDVLCCALGCLILLWLVYFKEAKEKAASAGQTSKELVVVKARLTSTQQQLLANKHQHQYVLGQLAEVSAARDLWKDKAAKAEAGYLTVLAELQLTQAQAAKLKTDLKNLYLIDVALAEALKLKTQQHAAAAAQLAIAVLTVRELEKQVGDHKGLLANATGAADDLRMKLRDVEQRSTGLQQQLAALKIVSKEYSAQLSSAEAQAALLLLELQGRKHELANAAKRHEDLLATKLRLERTLGASKSDLAATVQQLDDTRLANAGLWGDNKALSQQVKSLKTAAENRFAGIELTGSKVLFLIDMSGSMGARDASTDDLTKWPQICEIFGKLMQSLPELKEFQILMFSDYLHYPMGNQGQWIGYDGPASVKKAVQSLKAKTPRGGTNLSLAFEEAFAYRGKGMDTIYFLSDGLPNQGEGLPVDSSKLNPDAKGLLLGKYVRDRLATTWNAPQGPNKQRVRINAVGFFYESPDVGAFLWALARENHGSFVGLSKP